jgi:lysine/ornithine N-monooxygenase
MKGWREQFAALDISILRSPALAHPDMFDQYALLAYAETHGRSHELIESGCFDLKELPLAQSQIGLWKLPTLKLFLDFCSDLQKRLQHDFIQEKVVDINQHKKNGMYDVLLAGGKIVKASNVVLAMGSVGVPNVPDGVKNLPNNRIVPWRQLEHALKDTTRDPKLWNRVLVIGGGLTAVQAVQKLRSYGENQHVTICSRRPLAERHFDLKVEWFDQRSRNKCLSDFYHQTPQERLELIQKCRNGGSVPAIYMKDIRRMECQDGEGFRRVVGNVQFSRLVSNGTICVQIENEDGSIMMEEYDSIVLACGMRPDCSSNSLVSKLMEKWPIPTVGGLPVITEDARWSSTTQRNLYVMGQLASLSIGPDAANLMGIRRAAEIIANGLDCRSWLRQSNVYTNPFDIFSSDSDSDSETESETDESM